MKNRILVVTVVAGGYLLTCAAGFAQNVAQHHGNEGESCTATTLEASNVTESHENFSATPAAEPTRKAVAKTLIDAPVAKTDASAAASLREAQENPYVLLTYRETEASKMLLSPSKKSPTKVFGPGWGTNIDALRNNPTAPAPTLMHVDLKTLHTAIAKLL